MVGNEAPKVQVEETCPECRGAGRVMGRPCPGCHGTGVVRSGKTLAQLAEALAPFLKLLR